MQNEIKKFFKRLNYDNENIKENYLDFDYVYITNEQVVLGFVYFDFYDEAKLKELHRKYWNQNEVPITVLFTPEEIRIYNNYEYRFEKAVLRNFKNNEKAEGYINRDSIYSGKLLELLEKIKRKKTRVDEVLIKNLEELAKLIKQNTNLTYEQVCNFLSWCIFIKYLEDRQILTENTFNLFNESNFIDILNNGKTKDFSVYINQKLKGNLEDIFATPIDDLSWTSYIANFFRGDNIKTGQLSLFGYDFSLIPVELISNIYEKFLNLIQSITDKKKSGNFYTPYYLAKHIIDETFRKHGDVNKVLDPSCGSGVFLVSAYKKMCISNPPDILKEEILTKRLFGVDVNINSLKITTLSLYIAYLDSIEPKDIEISKKVLPCLLGTNLINSDFFDENIVLKLHSFDVVIGNPPWISIKGKHLDYIRKNEYKISDNQIAQSFMYRVLDYLKDNGVSGLIVTNSAFFSSKSLIFRENIFKMCNPIQLINLQNLKYKLFTNASSPASIIYFSRQQNEKTAKTLGYYLYENNLLSNYTGKVIFDYSQLIHFPLSALKNEPELWEKISFSSSYDLDILAQIEKNTHLIEYLKEFNFVISQGYSVPSIDNHDAANNDLIGLPVFTDEGIANENNQVSSFERTHDKRIYFSSNKLLISRTYSYKKYDNLLLNKRIKYSCIFNNKFYCIFNECNTQNDNFVSMVLDNLELLFSSDIYLYYQYFASEAWKNTHPEIRMERIKKFPVPKELFVRKLISQEQLFSLYNFNDIETEILKQTCDVLIRKNTNIKKEHLKHSYCETIRNYIRDLTQLNMHCLFESDSFYSKVTFSLEDEDLNKSKHKIDDFYGMVSIGDIQSNIIVNLPITSFFENGFSIIKTNDTYNWNIRAALNDIDRIVKSAFEGETT